MMRRVLLIALAAWLHCVPAWAQIQETDLPPVLEQFEAPARDLGFPKLLAVAIAGVESGLRPWVLNIEGQAFRFDSKEKALAKAKDAWETGQSFDVGLMQVNSWWLRRYGISLEAALDPLANIYFGGWILKKEIERHNGDLRAAVGAYHSPTPIRASRYADQVMAALARGPKPVKASAKAPAQARRANSAPKPSPGESDEKGLDANKTASRSGMLVASQTSGMAVQGSMKISATLHENSMKISLK